MKRTTIWLKVDQILKPATNSSETRPLYSCGALPDLAVRASRSSSPLLVSIGPPVAISTSRRCFLVAI